MKICILYPSGEMISLKKHKVLKFLRTCKLITKSHSNRQVGERFELEWIDLSKRNLERLNELLVADHILSPVYVPELSNHLMTVAPNWDDILINLLMDSYGQSETVYILYEESYSQSYKVVRAKRHPLFQDESCYATEPEAQAALRKLVDKRIETTMKHVETYQKRINSYLK